MQTFAQKDIDMKLLIAGLFLVLVGCSENIIPESKEIIVNKIDEIENTAKDEVKIKILNRDRFKGTWPVNRSIYMFDEFETFSLKHDVISYQVIHDDLGSSQIIIKYIEK